jgi:hypothetical protein
MIRDDHRKPLARYGAIGRRARSRLAPPNYTTSWDTTPETSHDLGRPAAVGGCEDDFGVPNMCSIPSHVSSAIQESELAAVKRAEED